MTLAPPRLIARPTTESDQRHARLAVIATFAFAGMLFAAWVPRIPEIKDRLGLSPALLGLALLGPAVGALVGMNTVGALSSRLGTARTTRLAAVLFCALAWLPGLAGSYPMLLALLFLWGLGIGGLDVAMNAQAVTVEKAYGRSLMSSFHASWSFGSLIGVGVGTLGAAAHFAIAGQQLVFALLVMAGALAVGRFYLADPVSAPARESTPEFDPPARSVWRRGPFAVLDVRLALLGVAGVCAMLSEGSVGDWSGILLRDSLHAGPSQIGLGFAAFMVTHSLVRLFGDRIVERFGRVTALSITSAIGAVGLAIGFATHTVTGAVVGFALLGIGVSIMVPVAISAAADGRDQAGPAIAAVSTLSYTAFLAGPTAIGLIANSTSVAAAMWIIPFITALAGGLSVIAIRRRAV